MSRSRSIHNRPSGSRQRGCLSLEVQRFLGAALREEHRDLVSKVPERFARLLQQLRELRMPAVTPDKSTAESVPPIAGDTFDPATLAVLTESFKDGWATLQDIGNTTITREMLARCLLRLPRDGQRDASRLSNAALVRLVARRRDWA